MSENLTSMVVIGAGRAFFQHYLKPLAEAPIRILGIVDPAFSAENRSHELLRAAWVVPSVAQIPQEVRRPEVVALVLTPDHYPLIVELAAAGFKRIMVEKPLVHRDDEVQRVRELIKSAGLRLYATDSYITKLFPLLMVLGALPEKDPRRKFVHVSGEENGECVLGKVEGVSVQIIEGGDFCLPDLAKRPWLEHDAAIGGVLLDLGIHALAPLVTAGLLTSAASIHHVGLAKISADRASVARISNAMNEAELYATALLTDGNVPIQLSVGKVPFDGGLWALSIRGENAMFYAGLRAENTSVLITHSGKVTQFTMKQPAYAMVIAEALMYFRNDLPGFDGNTAAFFEAREVLRKVKAYYQAGLAV
jgi:predicted dehydrogenase